MTPQEAEKRLEALEQRVGVKKSRLPPPYSIEETLKRLEALEVMWKTSQRGSSQSSQQSD